MKPTWIAALALAFILLAAPLTLIAQPGMGAHGNYITRLQKKLGLNDSQVQKIQSLQEKQMQEMRKQNDPTLRQKHHKAISAEFTKKKFNEGKVRSLMEAQHKEQAKFQEIRINFLKELHQILTPEQRKKYMELRNQWRTNRGMKGGQGMQKNAHPGTRGRGGPTK